MKPSDLIAALPAYLKLNRSIMLWGDPGIGKSEIIKATALALGLDLIDMRLNIYDPTELKGYPGKRGTGKSERMHFIPSGRLPTKGRGILFLDELPSATPATQAAAYQLILDRRLDEYELPEGWIVIAAGNYARNGGVHYTMPPALRNRFIHLKLEVDGPNWDRWASVHGVDAITRAFLRFRPGLLYDAKAINIGEAFPTPRSWKTADEVYQAKDLSTIAKLEGLHGSVGVGAGNEFFAYAALKENLPSIESIIASPMLAAAPLAPNVRHAIVTMLEDAVSKETMDPIMTYIERLDVEFQALFTTTIATEKRELTANRKFVQWCSRNDSVLFA